MVNFCILLLAVFLGWILYLTYLLYLKTKELHIKSSVVLVNTIRKSGTFTKKIKIANKVLNGVLLFNQIRKVTAFIGKLSFVLGILGKKINCK